MSAPRLPERGKGRTVTKRRLSLPEAAAFLDITERKLRGLAAGERIPFKKSKADGVVRFQRRDLDAWRRSTGRKQRPRFVQVEAACPECSAANTIRRDTWRRGPQPWPKCSGCGSPIPDVND